MPYKPLISNNLPIFSVNSDGLSLLDVAVLNNNRQLAKMLVTFGAQEGNQCAYCVFLFDRYVLWSHNGSFIIIIIIIVVVVVVVVVVIVIIHKIIKFSYKEVLKSKHSDVLNHMLTSL